MLLIDSLSSRVAPKYGENATERFDFVLSSAMDFQKLRPDASGKPLYQIVARALRDAVQAGHLKPGDALASESELAKAFGVSVGTLRKAVDSLVGQQILLRHQGSGTYVATHTRDRFLFQFFQIQARDGTREFPLVEILDFQKGKADLEEAKQLGLAPGDPVFRIRNRLSLQNRAVVADKLSLSAKMFKGLNAKRVIERSSTLYHLYQTEFGVTVVRSEERLRAVSCSPEAAKILSKLPGGPVIELKRVAYGLADVPVEYRVSTIDTSVHEYLSHSASA
jgi:GntR family transcriptional regulator